LRFRAKRSVIASGYEQAFEGLSSQFAADAVQILDLKAGERVIDMPTARLHSALAASRDATFECNRISG